MKKNGFRSIVAFVFLAGVLQAILTPQISSAGSLSFGVDSSGTPIGSKITIPYDSKFDMGTGAFNLEMWVRESSRVASNQQYTAQFFGGTKLFPYNDSVNKSSWGVGLTFDSAHLYIAPEVGKWPSPEVYKAGSDTQYSDNLTTNTKTTGQIYSTFEDFQWHHIAVSKSGVGGTLSAYLDGIRVLYVPNNTATFDMNGGDVLIGGGKFVGQIGDVRLVKGQALYSGASITVPTSQITDTSQGSVASNVSLLLKASSSGACYKDFSLNAFTVNFNGVSCSNTDRGVTSFNLKFDKQGHGTTPAEIANVNSIASSSLPTIANDGIYKFQGWSTTIAGTLLSGTYTATTDSTLYALWAFSPDAPTIGTVTGTSATSISVPYTAGAINGSAITGYTTTSSPSVSLTLTSTATANPLTYSGTFVQGQAYTFSMTATNGAGTSSSSNTFTSVTPYIASVPSTGIIGSVTRSSDTSVSIPFTAPAANGSAITAYTITSSPAITLTYSGTSSPMAVTGAFVQGQAYTFTIAATNGAGTGGASSISNAVTPYATARPDAPTIGSATLVDSQTVTVSFTVPLSNHGSAITSYKATSSPGSITGTSTGSPITVTGLTVNTPYTFTVTATNLIGESDSSTATTSVTPLMSYSVTFNSQGGSSVANGSFISGSTVAAPSSAPTRSGYTFNGWFSGSAGGSALVFPYSPGVTNAVTLYAQWTLIPVVVPPVVVPPVVQSGPPPSILKSITTPKISRESKGFYCEIGSYVFLRDGRTEELPKLTSKVFVLVLNGKPVESIKGTVDKVAFTRNDFTSSSTINCQVEAGQENLVTTTSSLNSIVISKYSLEKKLAIEAAYVKYYKDRTDAYAKKSQVFARILLEKTAAINAAKSSKARIAASVAYQKAFTAASNIWKKELIDATKNRDLSKALAQKQYLDALELAGVSIFQS